MKQYIVVYISTHVYYIKADDQEEELKAACPTQHQLTQLEDKYGERGPVRRLWNPGETLHFILHTFVLFESFILRMLSMTLV